MNGTSLVKANTFLANWERVKTAVEKSRDVDELKDIRDRAAALRAYAKRAKESLEVQNNIAEIKLRAERRIGELSKELPTSPGIRTDKATSHHDGERLKTKKEALDELGIDNAHVHRYEAMASLPAEKFEQYISEVKDRSEELTTTGAFKFAQAEKRKETAKNINSNKEPHIDGQYAVIYITASLNKTKEAPIADIAKDNCVLFIWTTSEDLTATLQKIKRWGFTYQTCAVWNKKRPGGGTLFRQQHELLLVATKGDLPLPSSENRPVSVVTKAIEHSGKPKIFYKIIERMYPDVPRVSLFAKKQHDGWDTWGNKASTEKSAENNTSK